MKFSRKCNYSFQKTSIFDKKIDFCVKITLTGCTFVRISVFSMASAKVAPNSLRFCDGGKIKAEKLNLLQIFNQGSNVEISSKAPLLQNRCYAFVLFLC